MKKNINIIADFTMHDKPLEDNEGRVGYLRICDEAAKPSSQSLEANNLNEKVYEFDGNKMPISL